MNCIYKCLSSKSYSFYIVNKRLQKLINNQTFNFCVKKSLLKRLKTQNILSGDSITPATLALPSGLTPTFRFRESRPNSRALSVMVRMIGPTGPADPGLFRFRSNHEGYLIFISIFWKIMERSTERSTIVFWTNTQFGPSAFPQFLVIARYYELALNDRRKIAFFEIRM